MHLPPLIKARLIRRYKRFLADMELEAGDIITAHVANSGAMTGLNHAGLQAYLSYSSNPKRRLPYSWELAEVDDGRGTCLVVFNSADGLRSLYSGAGY